MRDRGPAAGARRDEPRLLAALRARGLEPDYVVGHSVGEFAALAAALVDRRRRGDRRSSASAGSRWPRRRASATARWPRSSASTTRSSRSSARSIDGVWPANYNCPGQIVVSGEQEAVDELLREGRGARRPPHRQAQGLGRVPQPARRARRRAAAAGARARRVPRAGRAVHVDGDGEDRAGASASRRCSSSS